MTTQTIDQAKAEAFAGQMVGILNGSILALMTSIGHRTGLFDTMARPAAVDERSRSPRRPACNERYVREWLGAMVTGGIVEYDPASKTYRLPPEHAASLTRAAGPEQPRRLRCSSSRCMGNVEDGIVDCFRNGGGVPYSALPEVPAADGRGERADLRRDADRRRRCRWCRGWSSG